MTLENPYRSPHGGSNDAYLKFKARRLLERQNREIGIGLYLRDQWRRHLLFTTIYALLIVLACLTENFYLAVVIVVFWGGRLLRDIQWYRAMAREWESTKELLDWEKIQRVADDGGA